MLKASKRLLLFKKRTAVSSPTSLSGLGLWLKADAITGLSDGGAVSSWTDQSGNARHFTQATGTKQPTYETNEKNGLAVVRFDGTTDEMDGADFEGTSSTVFVVAKVDSDAISSPDPSGIRTLISKPGHILHRVVISNGNGRVIWTGTGGAVSAGAMNHVDGSFHIHTTRYDETVGGLAVQSWRDGVAIGSAVAANGALVNNTNVWRLGSEVNQRFFKGDIAEVIVYTRALTDEERESVREYLSDRWAIPVG